MKRKRSTTNLKDAKFRPDKSSKEYKLVDGSMEIMKWTTDDIEKRIEIRKAYYYLHCYNSKGRREKSKELRVKYGNVMKPVGTIFETFLLPYSILSLTNYMGFSHMIIGSRSKGVWYEFNPCCSLYHMPDDEKLEAFQQTARSCPMFGEVEDWVLEGWHFSTWGFDQWCNNSCEKAKPDTIITKDLILNYFTDRSKFHPKNIIQV